LYNIPPESGTCFLKKNYQLTKKAAELFLQVSKESFE
jgi:hypothetical protein